MLEQLPARIAGRIALSDSGCWLYGGYKNWAGYTLIRDPAAKKNRVGHRYVYELLVGPIPDGLTLDHLCRVRHCLNPEHLEPVTSRENTRRGTSPVAERMARTHCPKGHELGGDNAFPNGRDRQCRTCCNERRRISRSAD